MCSEFAGINLNIIFVTSPAATAEAAFIVMLHDCANHADAVHNALQHVALGRIHTVSITGMALVRRDTDSDSATNARRDSAANARRDSDANARRDSAANARHDSAADARRDSAANARRVLAFDVDNGCEAHSAGSWAWISSSSMASTPLCSSPCSSVSSAYGEYDAMFER